MKICKNCGASNFDVRTVCEKCDAPLDVVVQVSVDNAFTVTAKIFMTVSAILYALSAIPFGINWVLGVLANNWMIAMASFVSMFLFIALATVTCFLKGTYKRKLIRRKRIGLAFKICTLIFVHPVPGIMMLCDRNHR